MTTPDSRSTGTDVGRRSIDDAPLSTRSAETAGRLAVRAKRWPAYLLAACWPGAGHFYRRQWARGCGWFALYGAALLFLSSGALIVDGSVTEPIVAAALRLEAVTFSDVAVPLAVLVCSAIDLYGQLTSSSG